MRLLFALVLLSAIGASLRKIIGVAMAPMQSRLGHVIDKTSKAVVRDDRRDSIHYVTFEDEQGKRESFRVPGQLVTKLLLGDMGVVHSKGEALVHFDRVDV